MQLERLLKEEKEKLDAIFYGVEAALVVFHGPNFIVEMFNKNYQAIYPDRDLKGKPFFDVVPELKSSNFPNILKRVYETGEPYTSHEGMAKILNTSTAELEERYFDATFSRISYGEKKTFSILATPREVTDRVMTRKALEENLKKLEQERELRERFVSALTHDLRTPLAVAKVCSEFLRTESQDASSVIDMSTTISSALDRADRMIRDLLDASRISAGEGTPIMVRECQLKTLLTHVKDELEELHGPRFKIENSAEDVIGYWDDFAIHRVLDNLVNNAIKYGKVNAPVSLKIKTQSDKIEFSVHNYGNPIPSVELRDLFYHYRRSKSAIKSGEIGWGMGLAIVKNLVEAHGGDVQVESTADIGTKFTVILPIDCRK